MGAARPFVRLAIAAPLGPVVDPFDTEGLIYPAALSGQMQRFKFAVESTAATLGEDFFAPARDMAVRGEDGGTLLTHMLRYAAARHQLQPLTEAQQQDYAKTARMMVLKYGVSDTPDQTGHTGRDYAREAGLKGVVAVVTGALDVRRERMQVGPTGLRH